MNIVKNTNFTPGRNCGNRSEKVQYIVIHYTGSEGTAANNVAYFNNGNRGASAHYFVDRSGEIREYCDPSKYYAWHCGGSLESSHHPYYGKCTNRNSIGIEICTHNNGSNWEFTTAAVSAAVELTKCLMQKFNVPADRVCRHYDVTGKACPRVPGWGAVGGSGEWNKFKARLTGASVTVSLSRGDQGDDVEEMQKMLIACGYDCGEWGADGSFGNATESALEKMQKEHGLTVDGIYGPKSKAVLEALYRQKEKEKAEKKEQEKAAQAQPVTTKGKEINIFYPGYTRTDSPDDRQGAGCVWHDQDGKTIVIDAYEKNSAAAKRLVQYLVDNGLTKVSFVGTHAHSDHLGGGFRLLEDSRITVTDIYVYDPASLKLAGDGSAPGRSVQGDKEYLQKFIRQAKDAGAKVHYIDNGDTLKTGEIEFTVYRNQPQKWVMEYDYPEGWGYVNDGSLCLLSRQSYYMMSGDADASQFVEKYNLKVKGCEVGHHGNNGNRTSARIYVAHGCIFAIQCNNEAGQPGSCEFTRYGSGRMREAGVPVWQLTGDIRGVIKAGKITWTQGGKTVSWAVPFGAQLYRVRTAWSNSGSQKGAYNVLANAKAEADKWGGEYAVFDWTGKEVYRPGKKTDDKAEPAKEQTPQEAFISKVGPMARADMQKNGICAAVTLAQAILESGWGKSELAVNAKNLFGMKKSLSGNTWPGSTWDGKSVYSKQTKEVYANGPATVQADFRAYPNWQASVNDHSAYLAGARNGNALRYNGLVGETDYKKAATIIKDGHYATAEDYVEKICRIVEQYDLTKWNTTYNRKEETPKTDTKPAEQKPAGDGLYRVRKTWADAKSQVGAYRIYENARLKADETGLTVYDSSGKAVYTGKQAAPAVPFLVKVKTGMNIRKGPGTNYPAYRDCPVGVYTIVETSGDWGRLKAGGWIYIAQPRWVERV